MDFGTNKFVTPNSKLNVEKGSKLKPPNLGALNLQFHKLKPPKAFKAPKGTAPQLPRKRVP